jgi:hypothetical protein
MSAFKKVFLIPGQTEIAKVDRKNGSLYLSSKIWAGLPASEKNFVLYHEEGHLKLDTADEWKANAYAVGKFASAGNFTNKELGQKIMVMRSILDKADGQTTPFTADVAAGAASGIMQTLSVLGIGSKARQAEAAATAAANSTIYEAQAKAETAKSKGITTILLVAGGIILIGLIIYLTLRKK